MKKNSDDERPDFNFNIFYELEIYIHAIYKYKRNKKRYKEVDKKYYSYREWKNNHVVEKYKYITVESLKDLKWMFSRRLDMVGTMETKITGVVLPVFTIMITVTLNYLNISISILEIQYIASMGLIIWMLHFIIKDMFMDDMKKYLYKDYIEIIDELITIKSEKDMIDCNGLLTDINVK